jgi:hypothetical protein
MRKNWIYNHLLKINKKFSKIVNGLFQNETINETVDNENGALIKTHYRGSDNKIRKLKATVNKMPNSEILTDIFNITKHINAKFKKEKIKPVKLQQFHIYYTDNLISLLKEVVKTESENIFLIQNHEFLVEYRDKILSYLNNLNNDSGSIQVELENLKLILKMDMLEV